MVTWSPCIHRIVWHWLFLLKWNFFFSLHSWINSYMIKLLPGCCCFAGGVVGVGFHIDGCNQCGNQHLKETMTWQDEGTQPFCMRGAPALRRLIMPKQVVSDQYKSLFWIQIKSSHRPSNIKLVFVKWRKKYPQLYMAILSEKDLII